MKSGCISALRLQSAARGQFLLASALLSMCFAYGHTPLDSGSARACCPILDYSNSMLCYLEVALGKMEQLRGCAALSLLYTLALTQVPIHFTLSFNPFSLTHAVTDKTLR